MGTLKFTMKVSPLCQHCGHTHVHCVRTWTSWLCCCTHHYHVQRETLGPRIWSPSHQPKITPRFCKGYCKGHQDSWLSRIYFWKESWPSTTLRLYFHGLWKTGTSSQLTGEWHALSCLASSFIQVRPPVQKNQCGVSMQIMSRLPVARWPHLTPCFLF